MPTVRKILIYSMYFTPEPVGIAPLATDLAEYLSQNGWDVTVVTGMPKLPALEPYAGYEGKWLLRETRGKVKVLRAWVYIPPRPKQGRMKASRRALHDSSIALSGFPAALFTGRQDLILCITPPLQLAAAAVALKKLWACPLVNWLQDIVPDAALNVGMMQEGRMVAIARRLESFVYRHADRIAVISEGFRRNLLQKRVPPHKLELITNWVDLARFESASRRDAVRAQLGVGPGDFVLMHAGSMANKQVMENVVRAMKLLEPYPEIRCFLMGDGTRKRAAMDEAERLGTRRVTFLPFVPDDHYPDTLRAADLLILNQSRDLIDALVPSKLLTYLPSERPVIAAVNAQSEAAGFLRESRSGVVVEPENPEHFAEAVLTLKDQPEQRVRMGQAGARYVREHFGRDTVLTRFEAFLRSLTKA